MKDSKTILTTLLLFCIFVFLLTMMDFLALHDIEHDYLRKYIIKNLGLTFPKELPAWTATTGEWNLVYISLYSRFLFFFANIIVLFYLVRKEKR